MFFFFSNLSLLILLLGKNKVSGINQKVSGNIFIHRVLRSDIEGFKNIEIGEEYYFEYWFEKCHFGILQESRYS